MQENVPLALIDELHRKLVIASKTPMNKIALASDAKILSGMDLGNCIQCLKEVTDIVTSCERIKDTPIPLVLSIHLQQMLFLYLLAIPPSLVKTLGIFTIPATAIAAFTFFGVDRAAEQLSDPFGTEENDLPLDRFCADIESEYREYLGSGSSSVPRLDEKPKLY